MYQFYSLKKTDAYQMKKKEKPKIKCKRTRESKERTIVVLVGLSRAKLDLKSDTFNAQMNVAHCQISNQHTV